MFSLNFLTFAFAISQLLIKNEIINEQFYNILN